MLIEKHNARNKERRVRRLLDLIVMCRVHFLHRLVHEFAAALRAKKE